MMLLPIHLLRQLGYEGAEETVVAAHYRGASMPSPCEAGGQLALSQFVLTHLPIHLLQVLGYCYSDETAAVRYRDTVEKPTAIVRGELPATASG